MIGIPHIDTRSQQSYMGIRTRTPMKGMSKEIDRLFKELNAWIKQSSAKPCGAPFLRYHVIDMQGEMDIEAGVPVPAPLPGTERVKAGVLPAGRYATLTYSGSGIAGNKALIEWVRANGHDFDRWDEPRGDAFRSRYESYLTDPKVEPRKTKWEVEVAILLKGN